MASVHDLTAYRAQAAGTGEPFHVAIIGAGVAGICQAIKLQEAGIAFTIFEKADDIGGTWRDNTYPGCSCDVPLHLYQYSFEMSPEWRNKFADHKQIKAYLDRVVEKYGLEPDIRLSTPVASAEFDEAAGLWRITTEAGEEIDANVLVAGTGQLNRPQLPDIPGRDDFKGDAWHSATWNHEVDLKGKRIGVIGNGASAIQFVPEIAKVAGEVKIFQRSASWVLPRPERQFFEWEKSLYRAMPWLMWIQRTRMWLNGEQLLLSFRHMGWALSKAHRKEAETYVADPEKRAKLEPDYDPGCKRVLFSNDWWPAMGRDTVVIETGGIECITETGIRTKDGEEHALDVIVYATGFDTTHFLGPVDVKGLGGRDLRTEWQDGATAHLGIGVAGYPNFYLLYGPNTNLGHNSIIYMIECQTAYVTQIAQKMIADNLAYVDVRPQAQAAWDRGVQEDNAKSVFASGCTSWYKTADGRITNNWPNSTLTYWRKTKRVDWDDYAVVARGQTRARAAAE
ncbi:flavin-containing monooxygenase [Pyruvatibacter mobilis]|uniref:flavin-containing monooxygenase n=1 Tax=Pyruvatibacter mobilis TaxID=1712261 RepID=UPI003D122A77